MMFFCIRKKLLTYLCLSLASLLISCGSRRVNSNHSYSKNIFGADDRSPITSTEYPWRAIGRLSNGCSGTLVGRDLVLTAAHCVVDPATKQVLETLPTFAPNYMNGASKDESPVIAWWVGTLDVANNPTHDWAVLRLEQYLGDSYGWLGTKTINISNQIPYSVSLAGYSGDFQNGQTAGVHVNCKIRNVTDNHTQFLHDCDTTRGSSGGPMMAYFDGAAYIIGVNTAENRNGGEESLRLGSYDGTHPNFGVWQTAIANKIIEWSNTASRQIFLSLYWTHDGKWGWGAGDDSNSVETTAKNFCGADYCQKAFTINNSCFALAGDNHGYLSTNYGPGRKNNEAKALENCFSNSNFKSECKIVVSECRH